MLRTKCTISLVEVCVKMEDRYQHDSMNFSLMSARLFNMITSLFFGTFSIVFIFSHLSEIEYDGISEFEIK